MLNWQELSQQLRQIINTAIQFAKARRREEAAIGLAAILFLLGVYLIGWLPEEQQKFIQSWKGHLIIPGVFYAAGLFFLVYGIYRIWKLTYIPTLPTPTNRPSAIKGPLAFTPEDGELFRKLGREDELRKLLGYIQDDQVSLVVLMGASGAGKTSLLRAGLTDILKDKGINYHYWEAKSSNPQQALLLAIQQNWNAKSDGGNPAPEAPASLDELVNAPPELGRHVIILDQFEQLGAAVNGPLFRHLRRVARTARPPHRVTWVIAFRREYRASWSDFIIPEQERSFFPPELSLRLFTAQQARDVISQLIKAADLSVEQKVIDNLIEAATVDGEVSSVDIGIGLLVLSELHERQGENVLTEDTYHFAGGAEGLLTQYINRCFDNFPDEDRKILLSAMLALSDENTGQRIAEGKTAAALATEIEAANVPRLKTMLMRLTQRDIRLLEQVDAPDGDEVRFRLPHERLIPALNRLAGKLIGEREEAKQKLVSAFSAWRDNRASQYLLKGRDLRLVEQYQSQIPWGSDEREKLNFLQRSRRRRTMTRLLSVLLAISLVAGGWLGKGQYQRYEAMKYLRENNYPPELYEYQHQLKSLVLTNAFNLQYLPFLDSDTLEELTIAASDTTNSLQGLIDSFTRCPRLNKLTLDLSISQVREVPALPTSLTELSLDLRNSQVKEVPTLPTLTFLKKLTLDLRYSEVKEVPALPNSLTELTLDLRNSTVKEVPALPNSLTQLSLDLRNSQVEKVAALPTSLTELSLFLNREAPALSTLTALKKLSLDFTNSEVKEVPAFPNSLTELSLSLNGNQLKEVSALPTSLTELSLFFVQEAPALSTLTALKKLTLELRNSEVKEVPALPNSLTELTLDLRNSKVKEVPALSTLTSLKKLSLDLRNSEVKEVSALPTSLTELSLFLNREAPALSTLTALKKLSLNFSFSQVEKVPALPTSLTELSLFLINSEVKEVPALPTSLTQFKLFLNNSQVKEISLLQKLDCETLTLYLPTELRMSLKTIPKSVIHLAL